jgi:hypothetical protein
MQTFLSWFDRNRKTIGYTVGTLNLLSGLANLYIGNTAHGILWFIVGMVIIIDTKRV